MTDSASRERLLLDTLVRLTDTLVDDYDVVGLLQDLVDSTMELFELSAVGILLDGSGQLETIASSREDMGFIELLHDAADDGPIGECVRDGSPVASDDLADEPRWPAFTAAAREQGYRAAYAVPLRLRDRSIGGVCILSESPSALQERDLLAAQALADVATIGILHERSVREAQVVQDQLQHALNSRVVIEQAKGVVAQQTGTSVDEAFRSIRAYSRNHNLPIGEVARRLVYSELTFATERD